MMARNRRENKMQTACLCSIWYICFALQLLLFGLGLHVQFIAVRKYLVAKKKTTIIIIIIMNMTNKTREKSPQLIVRAMNFCRSPFNDDDYFLGSIKNCIYMHAIFIGLWLGLPTLSYSIPHSTEYLPSLLDHWLPAVRWIWNTSARRSG